MKKLLTITTLLALVSCGKELTQMKQDVDRELTNAKQTLDRELHNGVENLGQAIEGFGQLPRHIGNDILGTKEDTNERVDELENEVVDLQAQIDALREEMRTSFQDTTLSIGELSRELSRVNTELSQAINNAVQKAHTELAIEVARLEQMIEDGDNANAVTINNTITQINQLENDIIDLTDSVNDLDIVCESRLLGHILFRLSVVTSCEVD